MLYAEFEGLKDELERLLCKNRGLTRAGSPRTAAASTSSSSNSRGSPVARGTESSWHSRHSSSQSQNSSCSSFSGGLLGRADSQPVQPISAAEQASQQLNHDVDILLKQVDSVMAVPVLQLPSWFSKKPAAPSCTVTELPQADQTVPTSLFTRREPRVVTPKLKPASVSTADSQVSACQDVGTSAAASTATSASQHQSTRAKSAPLAASRQSPDTAAGQDLGICLSSASAAHAMTAREPDNLSILHFACATTPSQSDDTATTIKSSRQAQTDAQPSPKEWHTNQMADSDSSVSSTADSIQPAAPLAPAAASQPAAPSVDSSRQGAATSSQCEAKSPKRRAFRRRSTAQSQDSKAKPSNNQPNSECTQLRSQSRNQDVLTDPDHDQDGLVGSDHDLMDPDHDQDDLHLENMSPGWHRQPLQTLSKTSSTAPKLGHQQSAADVKLASVSAGQGGLMEGYLRGSSAKLQLPASVRTGSRKTAITARTPLKTITEVPTLCPSNPPPRPARPPP